MSNIALPALSSEGNLSHYLQEVHAFPMLSAEEEHSLAKRWKEEGDVDAAHKLVTSHLKLVSKIAMGFRGYGLPLWDMISEGNIGLMQAVKRFDPDRGFRLSTYAMWWIKASIQEYILQSWSLVKIGTTAAQKRLFFNLRKLKHRLGRIDDGNLLPSEVKAISKELDVSEKDVEDMNVRMSGNDFSLNDPVANEADTEWSDLIPEASDNQEVVLGNTQEHDQRIGLLKDAMGTLNEREQHIITTRRLQEPALTLEELSHHFGISRERVRQIESRAMEKLQATMQQKMLDYLPQEE